MDWRAPRSPGSCGAARGKSIGKRIAQRVHHGEHSRFAELNGGLRIHYQEAGAVGAPPIILIHGFCASTFVWSDVLLPLAAEGFRVIAMDLVGFGFSDKPHDGEYTIEYQARMIARLMEHLGVERGAVIGSSYGGAVVDRLRP
ncbi:MAG: alpha/beta fold hydrolase [Pyrinomonadaceae bacterium]